MRTVYFLVLFIGWGDYATAQTVLLPTWVVDSLIFETRYSRQCRITVDTLQDEILKLGNETIHLGTALKLSQSESSTLNDLLENAKESQDILTMQFNKDLQTEKKKVKRWRRIGIIQAVVIIVIILTPNI